MKTSGRGLSKALTFLLLASIGFIFVPSMMKTASGAMTGGQVYVNPDVTQVQSPGTSFSLQVKVANMAEFNTYDVQVTSDPGVINATDLSVSGNIFYTNTTGGTPLELVHCVNGAGQGCAPQKGDGPGVVHSSFTILGYNVNASGSGLLFTITYKIVSAKTYSPISMQNATTIVAIAGHRIDHATVSGRYGTVPSPDFTLAANPPSVKVQLGSTNATTITLTSLYSFNGKVNFTASPPGPGVTVTFSSNQTILRANGSNSTTLTINAQITASPTSYDALVNAQSGSLYRLLHITILVGAKSDFQPGASPSDLLTAQSSSNSTVITVTSINGFTGQVELRVQAPLGTTATFDQTGNNNATILVPLDGSANSTLRITTQSSRIPFRDDFGINVTSGTLSHPIHVIAEPPPPDFSVTATTTNASIRAGNSESVAITITSVDYYWGAIYELGIGQTGLRFAFEHGNFTLDYGQASTSALRIATDSTTSAGNYTITIVILGVGQVNGVSTKHAIQLNLRVAALPILPVSQERTFIGLNETEFFSVIITLVAALAVLGVFESRRSRRSRSRTILES